MKASEAPMPQWQYLVLPATMYDSHSTNCKHDPIQFIHSGLSEGVALRCECRRGFDWTWQRDR